LPVEPECFQGIIVPRPGVPRGFRPLPQAVAALPGRSFLIDGEAIVTDDDGLAVFELTQNVLIDPNAVDTPTFPQVPAHLISFQSRAELRITRSVSPN
jgi:hypothetical protein